MNATDSTETITLHCAESEETVCLDNLACSVCSEGPHFPDYVQHFVENSSWSFLSDGSTCILACGQCRAIIHGSISLSAESWGIMIRAFQERPQFTIKITSCRIVGCHILQHHLASAVCMRAFFVCVVRKNLLLENEFSTQIMFMHPRLPG